MRTASSVCKLCGGKGYYRQAGGSFTEPCGGCDGTGKRACPEPDGTRFEAVGGAECVAVDEAAVVTAAAAALLWDCDGNKTMAKLRWVDNGEAAEWIEDTRETVRAYLAALAATEEAHG
jgi:hypothetical protein